MPGARHPELVPPSRVTPPPPHETPTVTWRASRGSTQIEWRPGSSAPPPNHSRRLGWRHSDSTSCHDDPRSPERNSPPGSVPHHSVPGSVSCPASSAQTSSVPQGMGLPELGSRASIPSGFGGYAGVAHGSQLRPPSRERCSLTPKCPCPSATYSAPSRNRKSTRLNSSHLVISYAVFCLKKKKKRLLAHKTSCHIVASSLPFVC